MSALNSATSGLDAAIQQLNVSASNIANSQTAGALTTDPTTLGSSAPSAPAATPSPTGSSVAAPLAYQPLQLVQYSNADVASGGVTTSVQAASPAAYAAYAPSASYANANGQVAEPDIDLPSQIANQASALIQFQANLKTIQASDQMQQSIINQRA